MLELVAITLILIVFFIMIPIAHIAVRILCDSKSVYDVHFYWKPLNLFIVFLSSFMIIFFLVSFNKG